MSDLFVCRFCSAELPAYVDNQTCPECGCSIDLIDNNDPETKATEEATIKPRSNARSDRKSGGQLVNASELVGTDFGDYRLLEEIARGGMGVVFRAQQKSLDRFVALKMVLEGALASQIEIDRFKIEAQAAAHLDHPYIVPVYEIGEIEGRHFFSMALVQGQSLAEKIEEGSMSESRAAEMLIKIAAGINYAHQRGVIHRDLKPANILLDESDNPRITDFGLAKRPDRDKGLTVSGQALGTPSYMAPEQAKGDDVTDATDVYALGAILYSMVTGHAPFESETLVGTLTQVIEQEPTAPRQYRGDISIDLEVICLKCLEKDPGERYESAEELLDELQRFVKGEPINARPLSGWGKVKRWRRIIARNRDVRLQSSTRIAGYPLVDIAFGKNSDKNEETGHAKGVIALGDKATGIVAYGGFARGVFAMGQYAVGLIAFGMLSAGLFAGGMVATAVWATGGLAIGYACFGGITIGVWCIGMFSFGYKALGYFSYSIAKVVSKRIL